jgi:hypothetical protein
MIEYISCEDLQIEIPSSKSERGLRLTNLVILKKTNGLGYIEHNFDIEKYIWNQLSKVTVIKNHEIKFKLLSFIKPRQKKTFNNNRIKNGNIWKSQVGC